MACQISWNMIDLLTGKNRFLSEVIKPFYFDSVSIRVLLYGV